jgi:hypothetical protein
MSAKFTDVFAALRDILKRHAGRLVVAEDTASCYRLEGGMHPTHKKPFPIAWVTVGKAYVSFHHMAIYARPDILKVVSKDLRARMQGKSCFNFTSVDPALFAELENLTVRGFEALRNAPTPKCAHHEMTRIAQTPNKAPEPTPGSVTSRAD